jgi:hypothetical protein
MTKEIVDVQCVFAYLDSLGPGGISNLQQTLGMLSAFSGYQAIRMKAIERPLIAENLADCPPANLEIACDLACIC